jgi:hypothetical protein
MYYIILPHGAYKYQTIYIQKITIKRMFLRFILSWFTGRASSEDLGYAGGAAGNMDIMPGSPD